MTFYDTPHSALIGQMDQDFGHEGVTRIGVFDNKGEMLADRSASRRLLDLAQGLRSDCRTPERFVVRFDGNARSRMVILRQQP
ncbi:hypothetical protein EYF88_12980 [Paracoccus sediminis]|uniref:Uncharacterized protein n=1 Tax=Paracoccus sediminis TaxID=1214787 RepID=A0ABY1YGR0_9RHOB|nr:hypothetical protein [Paracoccus sediminis]TBN49019.1 hypothetical protein EYF88_12980 [Paracoccus sediminis]